MNLQTLGPAPKRKPIPDPDLEILERLYHGGFYPNSSRAKSAIKRMIANYTTNKLDNIDTYITGHNIEQHLKDLYGINDRNTPAF